MTGGLVVSGLSVAYPGGALAVRDLSLRIPPGNTYGLVGESGSGKSTVAFAVPRALSGGGQIVAGSIRVDGTEVTTLDPTGLRQLRGRGVAMVMQDPATALNPTMRIGAQLREVSRDAGAILEVLTRVRLPDPADLSRRWPHQLSGGQKQRVAIAMALLAKPGVLILDEPTTGLDATVEASVAALVAEIAGRARGMATLYISHNIRLIARVADRVGVMYAGRLVEEGSVADVLQTPAHPYTRALLAAMPGNAALPPGVRLPTIPGAPPDPGIRLPGCAFAPRCAEVRAGLCDVGAAPVLRPTPVGAQLAACRRLEDLSDPPNLHGPAPPRPTPRGEAIRIDGVTRRFGPAWGPAALDGVSFAIPGGSITALVGESGSGKTTLGRILIGLDQADEGSAEGFGHDLARLPAARRPRALLRSLGIVFQNPDATLNPAHSVGRILARALARAGQPADAAALARLLSQVRLPAAIASVRPAALSGGQRQRVAIARAYAGQPDLVIADEPVSALDLSVQAAIIELLRDQQTDRGGSILFISHDLALVRHIADQVVVLYRGRVVEAGPAAVVLDGPAHPYTATLLAASQAELSLSAAADIALPETPGAGLCPWLPRCARRSDLCARTPPPEIADKRGRRALCHHPLPEGEPR